jgi:hypothetical protein
MISLPKASYTSSVYFSYDQMLIINMLSIHSIYNRIDDPSTELENICLDINQRLFAFIKANTNSTTLIGAFTSIVQELLMTHGATLMNLSREYWNSEIECEDMNAEPGFAAFLNDLLNSLADPNIMLIFIEYVRNFPDFLDLLCRVKQCGSLELLSYNISGLISTATNIREKDIQELMCYWRSQEIVRVNRIIDISWKEIVQGTKTVQKSWGEKITELIMTEDLLRQQISTFLPSNCVLSKELLLKIINNTNIISFMMPGCDGFTTYDLKIFIRNFKCRNDVLSLGANFMVFLHELCYYLRRLKCTVRNSVKNSNTPERVIRKFNGEQISVREAGYEFEHLFFGRIHRHVNVSGAERLLRGGYGQSLQEFQKEFAKANKSIECEYIAFQRGGSEQITFGRCFFSRLRS